MASLPPTRRTSKRDVVNSRIGFPRVQTVCPCSADAFQTHRKQRDGPHLHFLETVRIGEFTLQKNRSPFVDWRGAIDLEQFAEGSRVCPEFTEITSQGFTFEKIIRRLPSKPIKKDKFVIGEQHSMLGQRER